MQRRIRMTAAVAGLAVVAATGPALTASAATKKAASVSCTGLKIGFFGALTGDAANLGINIQNGVKLALDQWNKANAKCKVALVSYDSQGSPDKAPALAQQAVSDKGVIGIVGPAFSGESKAAGPIFSQAGLPTITPSATNPGLSGNGWKTFHRALASDAKQGPAIATLVKGLKPTKVGVIDDQSEYGKGLADIVRSSLGATVAASDSIDPKAADYSAAVTKMKDAKPDAIFYGGYYAEAGKLAKQLRDAGVTSTLVFGDGVLDKGYIEAGGPAAEGSLITCTCAPTDSNPTFLKNYQAMFKSDPATYGPEAYDATNALLAALKAGKRTRAQINAFLSTYNAQGVTKLMKWDTTGEVAGEAVYQYLIKGGKITGGSLIK